MHKQELMDIVSGMKYLQSLHIEADLSFSAHLVLQRAEETASPFNVPLHLKPKERLLKRVTCNQKASI